MTVELTPTKHDPRAGRKDYEYRFKEVHMDEVDLDSIRLDKAVLRWLIEDESIVWKYSDKPPVIVNRRSVEGKDGTLEENRQAYYALSVLESKGWVSGWRRRG